ncbi:MAG TPA: acetate--CoA ligase family protein [Skermanella sp.]|nr:acetate--CoA ligase family protein [Skermanella sp.]
MNSISRLFQPASVAVIGASDDPGKLTSRPIAYLRKHGFEGRIYPVNPRYDTVAGLPCYADVASLPGVPDVAIVLVGANRVTDVVRQLAEAGTGAAIVLASGFGEAGEEGQRRQRELKDAAGPMRILGPNTIGLVNLTDGITLSASGALEMEGLRTGSIALVSQSGGILGSLLSRAAARGVGFSKLVATGNEADLDVSDIIDHLLDDDATSVVAVYLEGLRKPDRFREVAARAAGLGKPIVVFKVGRSESGARSAVSHTGALAGADAIYEALFKQVGIIRAETFAELLDIPVALSAKRVLKGRRVAVVTSTGGAGSLVADSCGMAGFDTPAPDESTAERLRALDLRDAALDRNPIDVTLAGLRPDLFRNIIKILFESPSFDAVIVIVGSSGVGQPDLVARPVLDSLSGSDKPLLVYVSPEAPGIVSHLNGQGVPTFTAPESCATALSAMHRAGSRMGAGDTAGPSSLTSGSGQQAGDLPSGPLNEIESKRLFAGFGIPVAHETAVSTPEEAQSAAQRMEGNIVLKVLSRDIAHKTEVGGVMVNIKPDDVADRCRAMDVMVKAATTANVEGFLVQEMVTGGVELILGFHRDPQLGPAILLGLGGITTELFKDTAIRLPPLGKRDAQAMIDEIKSSQLLKGFRGRPRGDLDALVSAILAFSDMIVVLGDRLVEAEINPLFVLPEGRGVCAADGLVVLS